MLAAAALDTMEEANFIFHKYDQNKDGQIDEDECAAALQTPYHYTHALT